MKKPAKPRRSVIEQKDKLREYRPEPGLTLRAVYQKKADLEKERLGIFALAQQEKRELNRNEKAREDEIFQELLSLALSESHLRRDQDRERAMPGIEEPDIKKIAEQFKLALDPAGDAACSATPGYDERLNLFLTTKMESRRRLTRETAQTKEKVRRVLHKIAPAAIDDDLLDSAERIARALVTARNWDSWAPSRLLRKFQRHVSETKRSLTDAEKCLRRIDIGLRELAASERPDDLQISVNGQSLDAEWEPGPLITSSVADNLSLSITSALETTRGANLILSIPGISAPKGAPRNNPRLAVFLITAIVFHKLTGRRAASIGTNDGRPTGEQWELCKQIWGIGWPEKGTPPEDVIRKAFKIFRDDFRATWLHSRETS